MQKSEYAYDRFTIQQQPHYGGGMVNYDIHLIIEEIILIVNSLTVCTVHRRNNREHTYDTPELSC